MALDMMQITLTVHGGCIQGSPSICMGRAFTVLHTGREATRLSHTVLFTNCTTYYFYFIVCQHYVKCVCFNLNRNPIATWLGQSHHTAARCHCLLCIIAAAITSSSYRCKSQSEVTIMKFSCPPLLSTQPDGNLGCLCHSVPGALQTGVDLSHFYDSFQPHHFQALITHVCGVTTHPDQVQTGLHSYTQGGRTEKLQSRSHVSPCEIVLRSSGSVMTSLCSTSGTLSGFLDSPQRLEPPCMLGMLRTAMPSKDMLLRSRGLPQHWEKQINRLSVHTAEQKP